jgi:hypothetical protein
MNPYCLRFIISGVALALLFTGCDHHEATPVADIADEQYQSHDTVRFFPSSNILPANHLKFYIEFPEAMARGDIFEYFSLINTGSGKEVPEPFREVELWDESGLRLTLWFHPGRQKPGVNLNVEIGPILEEGKNYTLTVSGDWQTESGQPLGKDAQKEFHAGPMDNSQPDPEIWQYTIPKSGTTDPLSIIFTEALDSALIPRTIKIRSDSNPHIAPSHNDNSIQFTPATPWKSGDVTITIDPILEDLAGNSIARPFNLDLQSIKSPAPVSQISPSFEIK